MSAPLGFDTLFKQFQEGEEKAFDTIYHKLHGKLLFFASQIMKDEAEAEDIVSEAFVVLWERRKDIKEATSIQAYLYTTVRNRCFDALRRQKRAPIPLEGFDNYTTITSYPMEEMAMVTELYAAVKKGIEELSPACRAVLEELRTTNLTLKEISEKLDMTYDSVKQQKYKGLRQLIERFMIFRDMYEMGNWLVSILIYLASLFQGW